MISLPVTVTALDNEMDVELDTFELIPPPEAAAFPLILLLFILIFDDKSEPTYMPPPWVAELPEILPFKTLAIV
ncbi:hypothetical protein D3C85_1473040 [compost metagenome]